MPPRQQDLRPRSSWPSSSLATFAAPAAALAPEEVERRANELIGRMTLEEKVGQLNLASNGAFYRPADVRDGRVGALINFNNAQDVAAAQKLAPRVAARHPAAVRARRPARLPHHLPDAACRDRDLQPGARPQGGGVVGAEAAHVGVQWTYAPMADVSRDPRWGRIVEGAARTRFSRGSSRRRASRASTRAGSPPP